MLGFPREEEGELTELGLWVKSRGDKQPTQKKDPQ